jgi:hypothetical protein
LVEEPDEGVTGSVHFCVDPLILARIPRPKRNMQFAQNFVMLALDDARCRH